MMNKRQKIALVILNIILFLQLCLAMYLGSRNPEYLAPIFIKYFFLMIIPTFILGRIVIKRLLRSKEPEHTGAAETPEPEIEPLPHTEEGHYQEAFATIPPLAQAAKIEDESRKRAQVGKAAALFILILSLSLLDSCFARLRQPLNVLNLLPGASVKVTGPLEGRVKDVNELAYTVSSELIHLSIKGVHTTRLLGEASWRGLLTVSSGAWPGEYRFKVFPKEREVRRPPIIYIVNVHPDIYSIRQDSKSLIMRNLGIPPLWVAVCFFCLVVLTILTVFRMSKRIERFMARGGQAEVYWTRKGATGIGIAFGLGTRHGVKVGDRLPIFDKRSGKPVGIVVVHNASEADSVGIVGFGYVVRHGDIVSINQGEGA